MNALLSIKPEFVEKIFSGEKLYEYRKVLFKKNVRKIVVYCTKPVGMIVGEFDVDYILEDSPELIWDKTKDHSGITKEFYDEYFIGKNKAFAINISRKTLYPKPINPLDAFGTFTAPQSFMYLDELRYALLDKN